MNLELQVLDVPQNTYLEGWRLQQELFEKRKRGMIPDTLVLAQHTPTITFGQNEKWNTLHVPHEELAKKGIAFHQAQRGGGAAYLGPGQLIGYTIMDIQPYGGVLNFMKMLEEVMIRTAGNFGIPVQRYDAMNPTTDKAYRATWYRNGKDHVLCTKGLGIQLYGDGSYTHHGFCLNVAKNNSYFGLIDPCGFPISQVAPISLSEIKGYEVPMDEVKAKVVSNFREVFSNYGAA